MKGADIIQIGTTVYGIKWFDSLTTELQIKDKELSELTKAETLPGPVEYAMRDIATKYMARVESMHLSTKISDALLNGQVDNAEQAAFMGGLLKGMALILSATHGSPDELKALAKENNLLSIVNSYIKQLN
jgi:hypothetical protein